MSAGDTFANREPNMHAILVLPALAWLLSFADWSERRRVVVVLVAATAYILLAGVVAAG